MLLTALDETLADCLPRVCPWRAIQQLVGTQARRMRVFGHDRAEAQTHGAWSQRSRARASGEPSRQTGLVHCELHHWWFGYAHYAADPAAHSMVGKLGPQFMDLSPDEFRALLKGRRGAIKTFPLDQDRIARIGNVYVQTPLWRAKIHPQRPIPSLSDEEIAALWQALRDVLQGSTSVPAAQRRGIDAGGAPFELNLPTGGQKGGWHDPYLFHWEEGAPCSVCGTPLAKTRTGSTGSYVCPGCQQLEPPNRLG
jgi:formamidopyrimidine-DNA glycosylase